MQPQVLKRLNKVEQIFSHSSVQRAIVIQAVNETDEDVQDKIERWKAGEVVDGIRDVYEGRELSIICIRVVAARSQSGG